MYTKFNNNVNIFQILTKTFFKTIYRDVDVLFFKTKINLIIS